MISSRRCADQTERYVMFVKGEEPLMNSSVTFWTLNLVFLLTFFLSSRSCSSFWKCFSLSRRWRSASSRALASASSLWKKTTWVWSWQNDTSANGKVKQPPVHMCNHKRVYANIIWHTTRHLRCPFVDSHSTTVHSRLNMETTVQKSRFSPQYFQKLDLLKSVHTNITLHFQ